MTKLPSAQRVGVFIDTQNLYHSAHSLFNANVNYRALVDAAVAGRRLIRAFAYVIKSESGDELKFFDALSDIGIENKVKDLQIFYSGEKKADWDVGLAMDIVRMNEKLDAVVLVSGDGDFTEVLKYVRSRGIRAEVIAFRKTTSSKLLEEADSFIDLGGESGRFLLQQGRPLKMASPRAIPTRGVAPRAPHPKTQIAKPVQGKVQPAKFQPAKLEPIKAPAEKTPSRFRFFGGRRDK